MTLTLKTALQYTVQSLQQTITCSYNPSRGLIIHQGTTVLFYFYFLTFSNEIAGSHVDLLSSNYKFVIGS